MANNPMFNEAAFERAQESARAVQPMTLQGTINKTFCLLFLCVVGAMFTWTNPQISGLAMGISAIGAFALAMVTSFKPSISAFTAPIYALLEGVLLGAISAQYNAQFKGIVFNAVAITFLVFFAMLFIYRTKIIKVSRGLMIGIFSATLAICVLYIGSFILSLFGRKGMHCFRFAPSIFSVWLYLDQIFHPWQWTSEIIPAIIRTPSC